MDSLSRVVTLILICTLPLCDCAARQPLTTSTSSEEGANGLTSKTHVVITNSLGKGLKATLHCKSKDDDLGVHVLDNGQHFEFTFHPNFFETTLFFCRWKWVGGWVDGVVYKAERDIPRCGKICSWTITKAGVRGKNHDGATDLVYTWN